MILTSAQLGLFIFGTCTARHLEAFFSQHVSELLMG